MRFLTRLLLTACLAAALSGCGWEVLAGSAENLGEAWCRHAENCYPACDEGPGRDTAGPASGARQGCR